GFGPDAGNTKNGLRISQAVFPGGEAWRGLPLRVGRRMSNVERGARCDERRMLNVGWRAANY
ncbi:hypothetical protein ACX83E_25175, partial [Burkholderia pseudomallei]